MKEINYKSSGVCSRAVKVKIDDNGVITDCAFDGGCNGNTQGVAALVKGMNAKEAISRLKGIKCNGRPTSCPDQLARALEEYLEKLS